MPQRRPPSIPESEHDSTKPTILAVERLSDIDAGVGSRKRVWCNSRLRTADHGTHRQGEFLSDTEGR